jgi:hypothetical protein
MPYRVFTSFVHLTLSRAYPGDWLGRVIPCTIFNIQTLHFRTCWFAMRRDVSFTFLGGSKDLHPHQSYIWRGSGNQGQDIYPTIPKTNKISGRNRDPMPFWQVEKEPPPNKHPALPNGPVIRRSTFRIEVLPRLWDKFPRLSALVRRF